LNISYNGSGDVFVSLIVQDNEFVFEVKNQDSILLQKKLGTGLNINDYCSNGKLSDYEVFDNKELISTSYRVLGKDRIIQTSLK